MKPVDTIILPRWLIPVDDSHSVLTAQAVVVDRQQIVAVGARETIGRQYQARQTVSLDQHALIPGLINSHTHAAMSLLRGYADDQRLMDWLQQHIWPVEAAQVNPEFMQVGTDLAIAEMLRSGTTCFNDMYFYPDIVAARAHKAGMRACVGMIVLDAPTVWAQDADDYLRKGLAVHDALRHLPLITTAFAPHAPYTVSDEPLQKIRTYADELDCQIHIHLHEAAFEIEQSSARFGLRPLERLDRLGLLSPRLCAVHMTQLLPAEIDTLAARGVHVVHCPQSNLKFANGFCPVQKLLDAGVSVALGTDGAASNNDLDLLEETRTAALLAKGVSGDPLAMGKHAALRAATLGGAEALGLDEIIGSISVGKFADLTAIELSGVSSLPVFDPVSQIIYSSARDQVSDVWVAGQRVLHDRSLTSLDEAKILADSAELGSRLPPTAGIRN